MQTDAGALLLVLVFLFGGGFGPILKVALCWGAPHCHGISCGAMVFGTDAPQSTQRGSWYRRARSFPTLFPSLLDHNFSGHSSKQAVTVAFPWEIQSLSPGKYSRCSCRIFTAKLWPDRNSHGWCIASPSGLCSERGAEQRGRERSQACPLQIPMDFARHGFG
ncbi:ninjurin 1 [Columba livia]|uniref:Ninjurin 1 n=1 Tax=Columba livia TaxID=8932 RepID=A0A2I0LW57_COLLI|nr:ninjurin 1 [Columba livia]